MAQKCPRAEEMNLNNANRTERLSTTMFYSEDVALLNGLENFQKSIAEKYPTFVEVPITKWNGTKLSFQKMKIRELSLKNLEIFYMDSSKNPRPYMDSTAYRRQKPIFNRVQASFFLSARSGEKERSSAVVCVSVRNTFILFSHEKFNRTLPLKISGCIRCRNFREKEDGSYRKGPFQKKK